MPLNLPDKLPAIELLKEENIFVIDNSRASAQDIRPLKIVILNLMPLKITTETDLVRLRLLGEMRSTNALRCVSILDRWPKNGKNKGIR